MAGCRRLSIWFAVGGHPPGRPAPGARIIFFFVTDVAFSARLSRDQPTIFAGIHKVAWAWDAVQIMQPAGRAGPAATKHKILYGKKTEERKKMKKEKLKPRTTEKKNHPTTQKHKN